MGAKNLDKKGTSRAMRGVCMSFKFDSLNLSNEIQVLKVGKFKHDFFGDFDITPKMLKTMQKNYHENVRKTDLAIDYAHENGQKAAGWFTDVFLRNDDTELWALIDWTDPAKLALDNKEWRYISAEFMDNYVDNESGKEFGPTLLGAGLTNRPFLKGMAPAVELQETNNNQGENAMNDAEIKALQDQNSKVLTERVQLNADLLGWKALGESPEVVSKQLNDLKSENKKLSTEIEEVKKADLDKTRTDKFNKLLADGKVLKAQESFIKSLSEEQLEEFEKNASKVTELNDETTAHGETTKVETAGGDVEAKVLELAEKAMSKDDTLDQSEAISQVLNADKKLADKYNQMGA